ncbi:MAG: hypothetical protein JEZ02_10525 [Desulfatibacillum sp.]|nr:hypothetical protein [Desulfatibacillum sp.]
MKLMKALIIAGVVLALAPCVCLGEFYRFKDASGAWVYTDNLMEVPQDQRPTKYEGVNDGLSEKEKAAQKLEKETKAAVRQQKRQGFSKSVPSNTDKAFANLKAEENALEKISNDLRAEQGALLKMKEKAKTPEEQDNINIKMVELNKKVMTYEKQRQAYLKKVDTYNRMLQKKMGD